MPTYTIQRGDTLARLARQWGVTVNEITALNNISNANRIRVGQVIQIPSKNISTSAAPVSNFGQCINMQRRKRLAGLRNVDYYLFTMNKNIPVTLLTPPVLPGTLRPSQFGRDYELVINGGFFWSGHPLGPTVQQGKLLNGLLPGFIPIKLRTLHEVPELEFDKDIPLNQGDIVSVYPRLVNNSRVAISTVETYLLSRNPRTAIGWNNKNIFVVLVDGRTSQSAGLSMQELATLMQQIGCTHAYNLDGGGSSIAVYRNAIVNRPSDGRERPVVTALAFG